MNDFDVLIASFNRTQLLRNCVESLIINDNDILQSIYVVAHKDDTLTLKYLEQEKLKNTKIESIVVADIPSPGESRNVLLSRAKSEFVFFIDDDAYIPNGYFDEVKKAYKPDYNLAVFGGPDQCPAHANSKQRILGSIMESSFVMGPTFKRHKRTTDKINCDETQLTLCNLWFRRSFLEKNKIKFDESLNRCEENILLEQVQKHGGKLAYFSSVSVYHFRRERIFNIFKIQFKSGHYRSLCFFKEEKTFKKFFLIPIFTGGIIIMSPLISLKLTAPLLLIHSVLNTALSIKVMLKHKTVFALIYTFTVVSVIHFAFSVGIFTGYIRGLVYGAK